MCLSPVHGHRVANAELKLAETAALPLPARSFEVFVNHVACRCGCFERCMFTLSRSTIAKRPIALLLVALTTDKHAFWTLRCGNSQLFTLTKVRGYCHQSEQSGKNLPASRAPISIWMINTDSRRYYKAGRKARAASR